VSNGVKVVFSEEKGENQQKRENIHLKAEQTKSLLCLSDPFEQSNTSNNKNIQLKQPVVYC